MIMNENETILDFAKALETLNQVSETYTVDIWIPSKKEFYKFKQLDGKQQKELLGAAMDTSVYNTSFIKVFYNIIKTNIITNDKTIVDSFTLADKAAVALYLRSKISNAVGVYLDDSKDSVRNIDIDEVLSKLKTYVSPEEKVFSSTNEQFELKVLVKYPTIKVEYDYDTQFKDNKKPDEIKTTEDIQKIVTSAFVGETSKYINKITINSNDVSFENLKFEDRIKLIEKLPSSLIQRIIDQISEWKTNLDSVLCVNVEGKTSKPIAIDSVLFFN